MDATGLVGLGGGHANVAYTGVFLEEVVATRGLDSSGEEPRLGARRWLPICNDREGGAVGGRAGTFRDTSV